MTYVLLSLFWSLAGLVAGYWLGRLGRLEASVTPPDPVPDAVIAEEVVVMPRGGQLDRVLGVGLVVLAVLSVAVAVVFISRQQAYVEAQSAQVACQNAFNRASAAAHQERADAAAKERAGQRQLLAVSYDPNATREQRIAAYRAYLDLLAQADEQRNAHPLPAAVC